MMLLDYIKRLVSKNIVIAFFIIDTLGFLFLGRQLPWYTYPASLVAGLLIGGYLVFAEINREVINLRASTPQLSIYFATDPVPSKSLDTVVLTRSQEPDFDGEIARKKEQLMAKWDSYQEPIVHDSETLIIRFSRPDRTAYTASVDAFLHEYRAFLKARYQFDVQTSVIREFPIVLENTGSVPADTATINILVPDEEFIPSQEQIEWHLFDREDMPEPPKEPDPSEGGLANLMGSLSSLRNAAALIPHLDVGQNRPPPNTEGPVYDEHDGTITYHAREILHNIGEDLFRPFILSLSRVTQPTQIRLAVRIHAANIPKPISDELVVNVTVRKSDTSKKAA